MSVVTGCLGKVRLADLVRLYSAQSSIKLLPKLLCKLGREKIWRWIEVRKEDEPV